MFRILLLAIALTTGGHAGAATELQISIDNERQTMTVVDGTTVYLWRVSTGGPGFATPAGSYRPLRMAAEHFSREWDDAPMPHSIFFTERGHAIHGTSSTRSLGSPVSHGCVRLAPDNAAYLFKLVESRGLAATRIEVVGAAMETARQVPPRRLRGERPRHPEVLLFERWMRGLPGIAWR